MEHHTFQAVDGHSPVIPALRDGQIFSQIAVLAAQAGVQKGVCEVGCCVECIVGGRYN